MLAKIEGRRRRGQQRMRWLDGTTASMAMKLEMDREAWRAAVQGVTESDMTWQLNNNSNQMHRAVMMIKSLNT